MRASVARRNAATAGDRRRAVKGAPTPVNASKFTARSTPFTAPLTTLPVKALTLGVRVR